MALRRRAVDPGMAQMRAVVYEEFGGPEKLAVTEIERPSPGPGEVLIAVRRAAVNPVDWKILGGHLTGLMPHVLPIVPGWDVAGVVEQTGPDTPEFEVGEEVLAFARKDWVQQGVFAEYVTFSVRGVARKPAGVDWDAAAGLPLAGGTALRSIEALGLSDVDTLLVHGGAGGVGSIGIQLAALTGARVIATASAGNHDFLRSLGAEPVEYGDGLLDAVRAVAPGGVTAVADFVGGVLEQSLAVLDGDARGRLVSIADPGVQEHGGRWIWVRPDAEGLTRLVDLVAAGSLSVPIASRYPLEQSAAAFEESMGGHARGKIVIDVAG